MDSLKINEDVCRICLKQTAKLHWDNEILNFCGISYKNCYYKYTLLEEFDSDCYPTSLCEMCANELENAHLLFEKALESFHFLQAVLESKQLETKHEVQASEEVDKILIETEEQICLSAVSSEIKAEMNELSDCQQIVVDQDVTVQPRHFIDIDHLESFDETSIQQPGESSDTKLSKSSLAIDKTQRCESLNTTSLKELNERCNTVSPNALATKKVDIEIKNTESLAVTSSSLQQKHSENRETISALSATKPKKLKNTFLMCAYCSKKISARHLAAHEAAHTGNRKRSETCPQCGIKLYTKYTLSQHMKTHDKNREKNYKCEFCGNGFYHRGALNVHRRKHLGLMVKCQLCTKEFFQQAELDRHLLKHSASPIQKSTIDRRKYIVQCQYCNKSVLTVKWEGHLAAHLDQPQLKCKICDKNFFSRNNCTNHLRRIHNTKASEFENCIHYYVDRKTRVNTLKMKQQLNAQPRIITELP